MSSDKPLNKYSVPELKAELTERGLETTGTKADLVTRLTAAMAENGAQDGVTAKVEETTVKEEGGDASKPEGDDVGADGAKKKQGVKEKAEYEEMEVPNHWLPLTLFLVRNVPCKDMITTDTVKEAVEKAHGALKVHSVHFDQSSNEKVMGRRSALVRLAPMPLPWKLEESEQEEEEEEEDAEASKEGAKKKAAKVFPPKSGDTSLFAAWAVKKLKAQTPALEIGGEKVQFEVANLQVQLYIGNLSSEWQDDEAFVNAMSAYGELERCFVMRNADGLSKGYGFVEFALPSAAMKCKLAMDEVERNMRPDPSKAPKNAAKAKKPEAKKDEAGGDSKEKEEEKKRLAAFRAAGWPEGGPRLVKLLRAEWANTRTVDTMFSRVLYVANLRTTGNSQKLLKEVFDYYGKVAEVTVPKNKATNSTKGFAFVLYANGQSADKAYRALTDSGEELGGALVSFANSAKQQELQGRNGMNAAGGRGAGAAVGGRGQQAMGGRGGGPVPGRGAGGRGGFFPGPGGRGMPVGGGPGFNPGRGGFPGGRGGGPMGGRGRGAGQYNPAVVFPIEQPIPVQPPMRPNPAGQQMMMQQQQQNQQSQQLQQMQMRLKAAEMAQQQAVKQAQLAQQQAQMAQQQAAKEAETRMKIEEQYRKNAAQAVSKPGGIPQPKRAGGAGAYAAETPAVRVPGAYGASNGGGYNGGAAASANPKYNAQSGAGGYGQSMGSQGQYGSQTGGGGGYGNGGGYGSTAGVSSGYGGADAYGVGASAGYGASDYEGGSGGYGAGSGADAAGYGQGSGYDQQGYGYGGEGGYGASETGMGGAQGVYGGGQADYSAAAYSQAGASGYGEGSVYGQQSAYGSQTGSAGQKRTNPFPQTGYGVGAAGYGAQGDAGKRPRY